MTPLSEWPWYAWLILLVIFTPLVALLLLPSDNALSTRCRSLKEVVGDVIFNAVGWVIIILAWSVPVVLLGWLLESCERMRY